MSEQANSDQKKWFIQERSEALAALLLTERPEFTLVKEQPSDNGADFIVGVKESGNKPATMLFLVQVKGTESSDKKAWMSGVESIFQAGPFYLPVCIFIINVRNNQAEYAWVAEPTIDGKIARLESLREGDFRPLDKQAVDQIFNRVQTWYQTLSMAA